MMEVNVKSIYRLLTYDKYNTARPKQNIYVDLLKLVKDCPGLLGLVTGAHVQHRLADLVAKYARLGDWRMVASIATYASRLHPDCLYTSQYQTDLGHLKHPVSGAQVYAALQSAVA